MLSSSEWEEAPRKEESGYASGASVKPLFADIFFTKPHLKFLNQQLKQLEPQDILRWCITSLPSLYQTTAFGLSGLVTVDMLAKLKVPIKSQIDLIFLDTLHHFPETYALVDQIKKQYSNINLHVYKPAGVETETEFATKYGERLWESSEDLYDWIAKVEPQQRAYADLQVRAILTGRRRSQGGKRKDLDVIEVDDTGVVKVNPLANWSFDEVQNYILDHDVPYNKLLDEGYKSIGDWHSTQPVAEGEDERSGRWKGRGKTECGIHNKKSKYAQLLAQQQSADRTSAALSRSMNSRLQIA
ncbi:MAG: hypothetical protein M1820_006371 [Bogoriella megaspora]|nr:MAG: hypothetical protein M1820_006371 [Bogoriella megaspora]